MPSDTDLVLLFPPKSSLVNIPKERFDCNDLPQMLTKEFSNILAFIVSWPGLYIMGNLGHQAV